MNPAQPVAEARIMEPNKCLGWYWIPIAYLRNAAERQHQLQLLQLAATSDGRSLPVSIDKLLEADSLPKHYRTLTMTGDTVMSVGSIVNTASRINNGRRPSYSCQLRSDWPDHSSDPEEALAWAQADDFARGAPLFQPLVNVLIDHPPLPIP